MKQAKKILLAATVLFTVSNVNAQYPEIPSDVQRAADSLLTAARKHSDSAWNIAYPVIKEEARKGKPYIPWATRFDDLPQASVPAFPGAEGGGKYSFGVAGPGLK